MLYLSQNLVISPSLSLAFLKGKPALHLSCCRNNTSEHLLRTWYVSGSILNILYIFTHLCLFCNALRRVPLSPAITKADDSNNLLTLSWQWQSQGLNSGSLAPKPHYAMPTTPYRLSLQKQMFLDYSEKLSDMLLY